MFSAKWSTSYTVATVPWYTSSSQVRTSPGWRWAPSPAGCYASCAGLSGCWRSSASPTSRSSTSGTRCSSSCSTWLWAWARRPSLSRQMYVHCLLHACFFNVCFNTFSADVESNYSILDYVYMLSGIYYCYFKKSVRTRCGICCRRMMTSSNSIKHLPTVIQQIDIAQGMRHAICF